MQSICLKGAIMGTPRKIWREKIAAESCRGKTAWKAVLKESKRRKDSADSVQSKWLQERKGNCTARKEWNGSCETAAGPLSAYSVPFRVQFKLSLLKICGPLPNPLEFGSWINQQHWAKEQHSIIRNKWRERFFEFSNIVWKAEEYKERKDPT